MIIKTIVPKLGEPMNYLGKPVKNAAGKRIGSITEVNEVDDHFELWMDVPELSEVVENGMYSSVSISKK